MENSVRIDMKFRSETSDGVDVTVLKSALQKYIRRSNYDKSLWTASRLDLFYLAPDNTGERIRTNFIHRLMVIYLEDIGFVGLKHWKELDYLIMDVLLNKNIRKDSSKRGLQISAIRRVVEILADKKLDKSRSVSHLNAFSSATEDQLKDSPYKDVVPLAKFDKNSMSTRLGFAKYLFSQTDETKYRLLTRNYSNKDVIDISKRWYKEIKTKEKFCTWMMVLADMVLNPDYKSTKLLDYKNINPEAQDSWSDLISKKIKFDDYVFDKHVKNSKDRTTTYFATTASYVEPESPLVDMELKRIYLIMREVPVDVANKLTSRQNVKDSAPKNTSGVKSTDDVIKESEFGEFRFRIQLTTSHSKTDVYLVTVNNKPYIVKGPFKNSDTIDTYLELQQKKKKLGIPVIKSRKEYMIPDRWMSGLPLGIRNKLDRTKSYPFLIVKSLISFDSYTTKMHKSKLWPDTEVLDPDKTVLHIKSLDDLNKQQSIDYLNAIAFRIRYKLSDVALRNFLVDSDHVYSIDEESMNDDFSLLTELKKTNYRKTEDMFKKYKKHVHVKLVKYLNSEFS